MTKTKTKKPTPGRTLNWSVHYAWDRQNLPRGLTVRLLPVFWQADRAGKRAALRLEVTRWLDELQRVAG